MTDKSIYGDSNDRLGEHWESFRKKEVSSSFPGVAGWIRENVKDGNSNTIRRKRSFRGRWVFAAIIPLLLIVTSAFKIDRKERFGHLINFEVEKTAQASVQKIAAVQSVFGFTFQQTKTSVRPEATLFMALVKKNGEAIRQQIAAIEGVRNLKTTEINYTVRESILSSFVHNTLNVGQSPKPTINEIENVVKHELATYGQVQIDISILPHEDQALVVNPDKVDPLQVDVPDVAGTDHSAMDDSSTARSLLKTTIKSNETNKFDDFEWLLGTWKLLYVPVETYHYWIRISDTVLKCYILQKPNGKVNLTTGFYLKHGYSNETELHLKKETWKFNGLAAKVYSFMSDELSDRANVTWTVKDTKTWQCQIFGNRNQEFLNFVRDESKEIEDLVNLMRKNHPDKDARY